MGSELHPDVCFEVHLPLWHMLLQDCAAKLSVNNSLVIALLWSRPAYRLAGQPLLSIFRLAQILLVFGALSVQCHDVM